MLWKKKHSKTTVIHLNAHTLHLIYVNALDVSQNRKLFFLLVFSNLSVYLIIHVYKIT